MSDKDLTQFFNSFEDHCGPYEDENGKSSTVMLQWSAKDVGFGMVVFYYKDGKLICDNEHMSREFIKRMLCKMVDDAEMLDPNAKDIK